MRNGTAVATITVSFANDGEGFTFTDDAVKTASVSVSIDTGEERELYGPLEAILGPATAMGLRSKSE